MGKSLKANKYLDLFRALNLFEEGEEYVNGFFAQDADVWFRGGGSFQVVLSNRRLFLAHLSSSTITKVDAFKYSQIERSILSRGIQLCELGLHLESGQSVHLRAFRHLSSWKGWLFDEELERDFLLRIPTKVTGVSHRMTWRTPFRNVLVLLVRLGRGIWESRAAFLAYDDASKGRDRLASSNSGSEFAKSLRSLDMGIDRRRALSNSFPGGIFLLMTIATFGLLALVGDVMVRIGDLWGPLSSKMGLTSLGDLIGSDPRLFLVLAVGLVTSMLTFLVVALSAGFVLIFGLYISNNVRAANRRMSLMVEALASQTESGDPARSRDERYTVYRRPETG